MLDGVLDLWVGDEHHVLREGDAITFPSRLPHWNVNQGEMPLTVLFCLTPPSCWALGPGAEAPNPPIHAPVDR